MKTLLLFILLPIFAAGQTARFTKSGDTLYFETQHRPIFDTIPVIMLVSDTIHQYFSGIEMESVLRRPTYLKRGYLVRKYHRTGEYIERFTYWSNSGYEHVKYLDANKKPMKPEIVIWDSKEVKRD